MVASERALLDDRARVAIADVLRVQAGRVPGSVVLDVSSREGFLARRLALKAEDWVVYSGQAVRDVPGNVEEVSLSLPDLPFEDALLGGVFGAPIESSLDVSEALAGEFFRVLVPNGRVVLAFRSPSHRAPGVSRSVPLGAVGALEKAGFVSVMEIKERPLRDGSEVRVLRAVKPAEA